MPHPINKIGISFDVSGLSGWLSSCNLWDEYSQRRAGNSPHKDMVDIWARYKDPTDCIKSGDWSSFTEKHESVWLKEIPYVKSICSDIMKFVGGSALGGVLITKLPAGKEITPHTDIGWHAKYYDKYLVTIKNSGGCKFCFDDIEIDSNEGDVYAFRNDVEHWVKNHSNEDRIAMVVCVKQNKLSKEGLCLGVQQ